MLPKRLAAIFTIILIPFTLSACFAMAISAAGTAGIVYLAGDLVSEEPYSVDTLWVAAMDTVNSLEMVPVTRQKDEVRGKILARGAEGRHVLINLDRIADTETRVKIRIGTFGDEAMSHFILDRIRQFAHR